MDSKILNISNIEKFFFGLLHDKLSKNIFFSSKPSVIDSSWKSFVIVDINIEDLNIGRGFVNIFLYVKSKDGYIIDGVEMSKMENKLDELVSLNKNEHYYISRNRTYSDFDKDIKFHFNVVSLNIQIV